MSKSSTKSFVTEIRLIVTNKDEKVLNSKFEAGRQYLNACLGEGMRRVRLIQQSKLYQFARSLPRTKVIDGEVKPNPERSKAFGEAWNFYDFSDYELQAFGTQIRKGWIAEHIDADTAQKLATRAFKACKKVLIGKAKRVRFKGMNQISSLEGKSSRSPLKWDAANEVVLWGHKGLKLKPIIDKNDPVVLHGLRCPVKYVRIVRRKVNNRTCFYAQLINEGLPFIRPERKVGKETIGLDIGPSTIAIVGESNAILTAFCPELKDKGSRIKRIQRKMSRSIRMSNPDCFEPSRCDLPKKGQKNGKRKLGKVIKGKRLTVKSKTYLGLRSCKANIERKLTAHRKSLQGGLVHTVVEMGKAINTEKLSYKAWQKMFGRSVGRNAPSAFVTRLKQIAESAGGYLNEFPTRETKLSQRCICGLFKKKTLSERVHECSCGVIAQRDLFSGYLARFVDLDGQFQAEPALAGFKGVDSLLLAAWTEAYSAHNKSSIGCPSVISVLATKATEKIVNNCSNLNAKNLDDVLQYSKDIKGEPE